MKYSFKEYGIDLISFLTERISKQNVYVYHFIFKSNFF